SKSFHRTIYHTFDSTENNCATTWCFHLGPNPPEPLPCRGIRCARCNECSDWRFTGDKEIWNWIKKANQDGWPEEDVNRWHDDSINKFFVRKDNRNCRGYYNADARGPDRYGPRAVALGGGYDTYGYFIRPHMCVCDGQF
ncbi:unnamed protein product, partial [Rotaria socialis]